MVLYDPVWFCSWGFKGCHVAIQKIGIVQWFSLTFQTWQSTIAMFNRKIIDLHHIHIYIYTISAPYFQVFFYSLFDQRESGDCRPRQVMNDMHPAVLALGTQLLLFIDGLRPDRKHSWLMEFARGCNKVNMVENCEKMVDEHHSNLLRASILALGTKVQAQKSTRNHDPGP